MLLLAGRLADVLLVPTIPEKQPLQAQDTNHVFYNATDASATALPVLLDVQCGS
jgi:hypothetical protein